MQELLDSLNKRRIIAIYIVILFALIAIIFSYNFQLTAPTYFNEKYNIIFANGLILYKLIELIIIYYFLFYRYLIRFKRNTYVEEHFVKLKKHTKLFFFLVPQGNTIFGLIAYKLSGSVLYFLLFSFIALITLILVKPNTIEKNYNQQNLN